MPKVGVIFSGCGHLDGSEIHEMTLTLYFLDKAGADIVCMAPNIPQRDVMNHLTREPEEERRNVLVEAARIARGEISDIKEINTAELDALIIPGGFGAAKNLSDFAINGADCTVEPDVARVISEIHEAKKPIGFICIAPAIAAKALGNKNVKLTIGCDKDTAAALEKMGAVHEDKQVDEITIDEANKVVSTPAYMLGPRIANIALGIEKLVNKTLEMTA